MERGKGLESKKETGRGKGRWEKRNEEGRKRAKEHRRKLKKKAGLKTLDHLARMSFKDMYI